ncbi:MAG: peptidoglycan recognition protein [Actinobacteria bacterium]|nr:peptidoglycan recognition protein [Actinomycetota bacterium]
MHLLRRLFGGALGVAILSTLLTLAPQPVLAQSVRASVEQREVAFGAPSDADSFSMIGLSWVGSSDTPPQLEVRLDGAWTPLLGVETEISEPDTGTIEAVDAENRTSGEHFIEAIWIDDADGYRVSAKRGVNSATVHLIRSETVMVPALQDDAAGAAPAPHDGPQINPRSSWGAAAPTGGLTTAPTIKLAIVHHTAGSNNYTPEQVPGIIAQIQAYHQRSQGWSDIGYNFLVDKFGRIWEGRAGSTSSPTVGAHAAGTNTGSVGVSVIGDYSAGGAPSATIDAVGAVIGWKFALHGVNPNGTTTVAGNESNRFRIGEAVTVPTIVGHRDVGQTDCPGQIANQLGTIRSIASTRTPVAAGSLDVASQVGADKVIVGGWGVDVRTRDSAEIVVTRNGSVVHRRSTNLARPDVSAVYPNSPAQVGFSLGVWLAAGTNQICAYVAETSYGAWTELGCRDFSSLVDPTGIVDVISLDPDGYISVSGWAFDPSTVEPIPIRVAVNGVGFDFTTGIARPDVAAAVAGAPSNAGFSFRIPVGPGAPFNVCVDAVNVGPGSNSPLICTRVGYNPDPIGEFLLAVNHKGQALLGGWALDPDVQDPVLVIFFRNGQLAWAAPAMHYWDGMIGRHPSHGNNRMFLSLMPLNRGRNEICGYAVNIGAGNPATLIGCHVVNR